MDGIVKSPFKVIPASPGMTKQIDLMTPFGFIKSQIPAKYRKPPRIRPLNAFFSCNIPEKFSMVIFVNLGLKKAGDNVEKASAGIWDQNTELAANKFNWH